MRLRRFLLSSFAFALCLLVGYSGMSLNASAVDYTMTYMSEDVFRALLLNGSDHLNGYYYSTSGVYKPCTFVPRPYYTMWVGSDSVTDIQQQLAQAPCLSFGCTDVGDDIALSGNPVFPLFKIELNLHLGNVRECYFGANLFASDNPVYWTSPVQTYRPYSYLVAGSSSSSVVYLSANSSGYPNRTSIATSSGAINNFHSSVLGSFKSSTGSDLYISEFNCCAVSGVGEYNISFILPKINNDYIVLGNTSAPSPSISSSHVTGSITDSSESSGSDAPSSQQVDITVETDNSGLVGGIISGIKNLFVPTDEDLQGFTDDMHTLAQDHLGGLYDAVDILDDAFSGLSDLDARESIHVDPLTIPLLGSDSLTLGNWDVPLKPSTSGGFALLYDGIALLVDFIAAFAFLRMCRNKLDIILNPAAEVVSE